MPNRKRQALGGVRYGALKLENSCPIFVSRNLGKFVMTEEGNRKREESLRVFNQAAFIYDQVGPGSFSYFGQRLVDFAEIPSGANVLDVAAGRGALLFPTAARVGSTGHVTGIDFAPNMVRT
jgi:ubiquinone/menaquinone biosynthesis C-methylase UbiE